MKVIRYTWGFWAQVLAVIPTEIGVACIVISRYISADYEYLGGLVFFPFLLYFTPLHCKDYFTIVTFSEKGVKASLFGRTWFEASWGELTYIGEYISPYRGGGNYEGGCARWMYFSLEPMVLETWLLGQGAAPKCNRVGDNAIFTMMSTKQRKKLLEYIPEEQIEWRGWVNPNSRKFEQIPK